MGNKTVFKINNQTLYGFFKDQINLITYLLNILKNLIFTKNIQANFQIDDCFENFTHEPIFF